MASPKERRTIIHTGTGGYDLFLECVEEKEGFSRVYIGKKVPRILRKLKITIKLSPKNIYYKLVKIN